MADKKPLIQATGLWETTDKSGNMVLSGNMGNIRVVIFKNTRKEKSNQPDFNMYFTEQVRKDEKPSASSDESDEFPF